MSLKAFRRWSRVIAALLLCATAGLPHIALDDAACVPAAIPSFGDHDESQHVFQSGTPIETEHCAVCHWARSLRAPRASLIFAIADIRPPHVLSHPVLAAVDSAILEHLPARAPPSALL